MPTYLIYPELNLEFSVVKRSKSAVGIAQAASGREVRINYWNYPMWEWDLSYEYLPDSDGGWLAGVTASDIRTLMAFYTIHTNFQSFLFLDDDDNTVVEASNGMATGDGAQTVFTVTRAYGAAGFFTFEPVGYVNLAKPFNVYVDHILVDPGDYVLDQTYGYRQTITFTTPPGLGAIISADVSYYFLCTFKDGQMEFEKFFDKLWSLKRCTLRSSRE